MNQNQNVNTFFGFDHVLEARAEILQVAILTFSWHGKFVKLTSLWKSLGFSIANMVPPSVCKKCSLQLTSPYHT